MLKMIGFWRSAEHGGLSFPHPREFVDPDWEVDNRAAIARYLRSGVSCGAFMGWSWCRFRGGPKDSEMGDQEFTDGEWMWPEGLAVYVEKFSVRLPDEFVQHMQDLNFQPPREVPAEVLSCREFDLSFWQEWAKTHSRYARKPLTGFLFRIFDFITLPRE